MPCRGVEMTILIFNICHMQKLELVCKLWIMSWSKSRFCCEKIFPGLTLKTKIVNQDSMTGSWITTISSSRYLLLLLSLKVTNTDKIVQVTSCKHIQHQIVSTVKQLSFRHLISLDDDSNKLWSSSKIIHIVVETRILNWVTRIINHQTIFCALRNFSRECEVCRE